MRRRGAVVVVGPDALVGLGTLGAPIASKTLPHTLFELKEFLEFKQLPEWLFSCAGDAFVFCPCAYAISVSPVCPLRGWVSGGLIAFCKLLVYQESIVRKVRDTV